MIERTAHKLLFIGFLSVVTVPTVARADETMVTLEGHLQVPVGPHAQGVTVHRQVVQGRSYVTISAPASSTTSRCGVPLQRVTVWERLADHTWSESLSDVWETCAHVGTRAVQRTVTATVMNATEARVTFSVPNETSVTDSFAHYVRMGDRFVGPHHEGTLSSAPGESSHGAINPAPTGSADADLHAWQANAPLVSAHGATLWLGTDGRALRFAAHLPPSASPTMTLALAEAGVSTDVLLSNADNHGRFVTVRCDATAPRDATVQCHRSASGTDITGSTDMGTMVWASRTVSTVQVYARLGEGTTSVTTDASARMHSYTLTTPVELLDHVSGNAVATCAGTRFHTWLPADSAAGVAGMRVLACGDHCEDGDCERHALGDDLPRVALAREGGTFCTALTGAGSDAVHTCGNGDTARLLASLPVPGFTTVVAIDRQQGQGASARHRAEVWAIVSPSAGWRALWRGNDERSPGGLTVDVEGLHPSFCAVGGACQAATEITLLPPDRGPVSVSVSLLARASGLRAAPRF